MYQVFNGEARGGGGVKLWPDCVGFKDSGRSSRVKVETRYSLLFGKIISLPVCNNVYVFVCYSYVNRSARVLEIVHGAPIVCVPLLQKLHAQKFLGQNLKIYSWFHCQGFIFANLYRGCYLP